MILALLFHHVTSVVDRQHVAGRLIRADDCSHLVKCAMSKGHRPAQANASHSGLATVTLHYDFKQVEP